MKIVFIAFLGFLIFFQNGNAQCISIYDWHKTIPSHHLPASVSTQRANNNLDVVKFNEKYYVVYRTAIRMALTLSVRR